MIIVRVERWPDDSDPNDPRQHHRRTDIAQATIKNDRTGDREVGNYDVSVYDPPSYNPWSGAQRSGRVEGFHRREFGVWELVRRALNSTTEEQASDSADG